MRLGERARRGVTDHGPTALVVALLVATAAAFVWTERQKLRPPPFAVSEVDETFSPVCRCATGRATILLELPRAARLTVVIVDGEDEVVRTLVEERRVRGATRLEWDGRDDAGAVVADGEYRPRVRVSGNRRAFLLPNPILVDTTPPQITLVRVHPKLVMTNREGRRGRVSVFYRISERAQPLLYVNDRLRVEGRLREGGKLDWYGRALGKPVRRGRYELRLAARDEAGNVGPLTPPVTVRVR